MLQDNIYSIWNIVYSMQYNIQYILYIVQYIAYIIYYILQTMYYILYTVYYILYTACYIVYSTYSTQYIAYTIYYIYLIYCIVDAARCCHLAFAKGVRINIESINAVSLGPHTPRMPLWLPLLRSDMLPLRKGGIFSKSVVATSWRCCLWHTHGRPTGGIHGLL